MQEKYMNLLDQLEQERNLEKKEREEKIRRIMNSFAETIVKD